MKRSVMLFSVIMLSATFFAAQSFADGRDEVVAKAQGYVDLLQLLAHKGKVGREEINIAKTALLEAQYHAGQIELTEYCTQQEALLNGILARYLNREGLLRGKAVGDVDLITQYLSKLAQLESMCQGK